MRLLLPASRVRYADGHRLQLEIVEARQRGEGEDTFLLLEHEPVITLGRSAPEDGVRVGEEQLSRLRVDVHRVERGGQTTWHGPGQLTGYPIIDLRAARIGVREHVHRLEETMLRTAARFGVEAFRRPGVIGLFTAKGKLGAVGVRVARGVAFHGFAFNVCPDLDAFSLIVPCGMPTMPTTSLAALVSPAPTLADARATLIDVFAEVYDVRYLEPA